MFDGELQHWGRMDDRLYMQLFRHLSETAPRAVNILVALAEERGVQISPEALEDMNTIVKAWAGRLL
jgi:hypothetical protein